MFKKNCCDGIYNSFDVHFTSVCDNKCSFCIDNKYEGINCAKPNPKAIATTIIENQEGYDDVLFLGGEPMLYMNELLSCILLLKKHTSLKLFITSAMPKTCYDDQELFFTILGAVDGFNISAQHSNESIADEIRGTKSLYDRQAFYASLPFKEKIRINLNINKPYLYTKEDITGTLLHYDSMGFNSIKLSEIQHGAEYFVSFEDVFGVKMKSAYANGCQTYIDTIDMKTPLLLKRSCFMCEETLKASLMDGLKTIHKATTKAKATNRYAVIYEDGSKQGGWI